jgi:hypothetical protein
MIVRNPKSGLEETLPPRHKLLSIQVIFKGGKNVIPYCDLKKDGCFDYGCTTRCPFYTEYEVITQTK